MIIGYQVRDKHGQFWAGRSAREVLAEGTAKKELDQAQKRYRDDGFEAIAIWAGQIADPIFVSPVPVLNSQQGLVELAAEFEGEIELVNPTQQANSKTIESARRIVQRSNEQCTILIPDNVQTLWSGSGCGEWLPAMVYIPNHEIF